MSFSGTFNFPLIGKAEIKFVIKNTVLDTIGDKDVLRLGVEFISAKKDVISVIAQYALQFSNASSLEELEMGGLAVKKISRRYEVGYCKTEGDFDQVLKIRKGKSQIAHHNFADIYDTRSRIFMCKNNNKIVASVRMQLSDHKENLSSKIIVRFPLISQRV